MLHLLAEGLIKPRARKSWVPTLAVMLTSWMPWRSFSLFTPGAQMTCLSLWQAMGMEWFRGGVVRTEFQLSDALKGGEMTGARSHCRKGDGKRARWEEGEKIS